MNDFMVVCQLSKASKKKIFAIHTAQLYLFSARTNAHMHACMHTRTHANIEEKQQTQSVAKQ